jgi:hypothetical protein
MAAPEMRLFGNGLLLSEYRENNLVLKHISLENGALVKESSVPACSGTKLSIGSGEIGLCDRESGLISILDEDFHLHRTYEVTQEVDDWYLNSELDSSIMTGDLWPGIWKPERNSGWWTTGFMWHP